MDSYLWVFIPDWLPAVSTLVSFIFSGLCLQGSFPCFRCPKSGDDDDYWCLTCLSRLFHLSQHSPPVFRTFLSMNESMGMEMTEPGHLQ